MSFRKCVYVWVCVSICEYVWSCLSICDHAWWCESMCEHVWICVCMDAYVIRICEHAWACVRICWFVWVRMRNVFKCELMHKMYFKIFTTRTLDGFSYEHGELPGPLWIYSCDYLILTLLQMHSKCEQDIKCSRNVEIKFFSTFLLLPCEEADCNKCRTEHVDQWLLTRRGRPTYMGKVEHIIGILK